MLAYSWDHASSAMLYGSPDGYWLTRKRVLLQRDADLSRFIKTFTGSRRFTLHQLVPHQGDFEDLTLMWAATKQSLLASGKRFLTIEWGLLRSARND